jgi:hypothetical protein
LGPFEPVPSPLWQLKHFTSGFTYPLKSLPPGESSD